MGARHVSEPLERLKTALAKFGRTKSRAVHGDGVTDSLDHVTAALSDRYAIEQEIGSGGMATVYRAEDLKHHRKVAIKVMRPELAANLGSERFLREVGIAAKLNHPHILGLHDSGEAAGFLYFVMPYVEGEPLRAKMKRERQLSIDDAVELIRQVGSALDYAHDLGVIHRDIKPENILLHRNVAVVADFGIALAVTAAGGERLTETGLSLGTPAYMSPEQVAGESEIDRRSDIYSLACVLYEMLSGDPPFVASNPRAVLMKHMSDPAPSITTVRSAVTRPIAEAIARALGKVPADRFDSATAFIDALSAQTTDAEPEDKSIVVLPFDNLSPDPDNEFFADGLTEELIAELSEVRQLRVISRTSAMQFKDTQKGIPAIARELNVRFVLEGSVRRAGQSVRITAQLIDASTDSHLWADRYTGSLNDVFDLQEQLSRRIADALRVTLTPEEGRRMAYRRLDDFRAYDALIHARQEMMMPSKASIGRALQFIQRAQEIAGDNALIHATFAQLYTLSYEFGISHESETLQLADKHASKALELAPDLGLALFAKARVRFKEGDFKEAVRLLRRARDLDRNPDALSFLGAVLAMLGNMEEAREVMDDAVDLDPLDLYTLAARAWVDLLDGQFETAASRFQEALHDLGSDNTHVYWCMAVALAHSGRLDEALKIFSDVAKTDAMPVADLSELYCTAAEGNLEAVNTLMSAKRVMVEVAKTDEMFPLFIANCLVMVGDEDGALEWLGRAIDWGFCNYRYLEEYDPFLRPLHSNPHFTQLMVKARQKQKAFDP